MSEDDEHWEEAREPTYFFHERVYYHGLRPTNEGWLIYKRTWREPIKTDIKEFTTCGLFNFLAQRKFYNGWEERWKDQSAYSHHIHSFCSITIDIELKKRNMKKKTIILGSVLLVLAMVTGIFCTNLFGSRTGSATLEIKSFGNSIAKVFRHKI